MPIKEILLPAGSSIVKVKTGLQAIQSSKKHNSSSGAGHSGQGIVDVPLVQMGH